MESVESHKRHSMTLLIVLAMLCGVLYGSIFNSYLTALGQIGKIVIQLIKAFAVPLVFFAILDAVSTTKISIRGGGRMLSIALINAAIAASIGLVLADVFSPGKHFNSLGITETVNATQLLEYRDRQLNLSEIVNGFFPTSLLSPFLENNVIAVVLLALLLGAALRRTTLTAETNLLRDLIKQLFAIFESAVGYLIYLIPFAVFGVTARTVAEYGFQPFKTLFLYAGVAVLGMFLQVLIVYQSWIFFIAGRSLKSFWAAAKEPVTYAFGTNSSLATLPITLSALDQLKVPKECSRLGAVIGTNLNNDGILLYEAMAVIFVAQAYGIDLSIFQQLSVACFCMLAAVGVAGIPEAGIISLSLVLTTCGLPVEILPLLLTVDWFVGRMRSVTNVLSDMTVSIALGSRLVKEGGGHN